MDADIVQALEIITRNIKHYITVENTAGGLLEDVKTIISSANSKKPIDEPAIWIVQHPTIMEDEKQINLNGVQYLETTFEFVCVEYADDIEEAEQKGLNLACRVGKSILKNYNTNNVHGDPKHIFKNVNMEALYPVGEINVEGKKKGTPATSIIFKFTYQVNWKKCRLPKTGE